MTRRHATRGFTLIEVIVVLVVASIVLALGVTSLSRVVEDNRIRSVTEEFREGLALARMEAIQRNRTVRFDVSGAGWSVVLPPSGTVTTDTTLQSKAALGSESGYGVTSTASSVSFTSSGRPSVANYQINVTKSGATCAATSGGTARCLRILVTAGGSIRTCDPAVAAGDPRSCS